MKNINILPTDKPSRIYLIKSNNKLGITSDNPEFTENFGGGTQNQNIYITSDEEIKEGYWLLNLNGIFKAKANFIHGNPSYKKIILTTDLDLIKDGVQAIDDEFLEWFVKNPNCENVEVVIEQYTQNYHKDIWYNRYKIIIPREHRVSKSMVDYFKSEQETILESKQKTKDRIMSETSEETKQKAIDYGNSLVMKQTAVDLLIEQIKSKADSLSTSTKESRIVKGIYVDCLCMAREVKEIEKEQQGYSEEEVVEFANWKDINCFQVMGSNHLFYIRGCKTYDEGYTNKELFETFKIK